MSPAREITLLYCSNVLADGLILAVFVSEQLWLPAIICGFGFVLWIATMILRFRRGAVWPS